MAYTPIIYSRIHMHSIISRQVPMTNHQLMLNQNKSSLFLIMLVRVQIRRHWVNHCPSEERYG